MEWAGQAAFGKSFVEDSNKKEKQGGYANINPLAPLNVQIEQRKAKRKEERSAAVEQSIRDTTAANATAEQEAARNTAREKLRALQARRANRSGTLLTLNGYTGGTTTLGG